MEEVSALIGGTFLAQSLIALGFGLVGILLYVGFRFEWSFAVGGFVAVLHDVLITVGIVLMLGGQLSLIHVGAILTVAGYSVNDTIVIFDLIRENLALRGGSVKTLMNEAINATLSRTVTPLRPGLRFFAFEAGKESAVGGFGGGDRGGDGVERGPGVDGEGDATGGAAAGVGDGHGGP